MTNRTMLRRTLALILGSSMVCGTGIGFAFDMGNMMNPSKWMGGGRDRDYDEGPWGGPGYGYGGPGYGYGGPGYGYGGPGYGYGGPGYGYGGPGYGYGGPGYGYGGPGGYAAPGGYGAPGGYASPPPPASAATGDDPRSSAAPRARGGSTQSEIDALKSRINQLERGEPR